MGYSGGMLEVTDLKGYILGIDVFQVPSECKHVLLSCRYYGVVRYQSACPRYIYGIPRYVIWLNNVPMKLRIYKEYTPVYTLMTPDMSNNSRAPITPEHDNVASPPRLPDPVP